MSPDERRVATDVVKLVAAEPKREWTCAELAANVVVEAGPSRFVCPVAYMKRVLDGLVRGGHLAVRRARWNLYKLHPDVAKRPELPSGWFYNVLRGAVSSWPVIVTDRWGLHGGPVLLRFDEQCTRVIAYLGSSAGQWCEDARRRALAQRSGWEVRDGELFAPWGEARELADAVAGWGR